MCNGDQSGHSAGHESANASCAKHAETIERIEDIAIQFFRYYRAWDKTDYSASVEEKYAHYVRLTSEISKVIYEAEREIILGERICSCKTPNGTAQEYAQRLEKVGPFRRLVCPGCEKHIDDCICDDPDVCSRHA